MLQIIKLVNLILKHSNINKNNIYKKSYFMLLSFFVIINFSLIIFNNNLSLAINQKGLNKIIKKTSPLNELSLNVKSPPQYIDYLIDENKYNEQKKFSAIFDIPITYNTKVQKWIKFFQTRGKNNFIHWIEESGKFLPVIRKKLTKANLPLDLSYVAMIESGFSPFAISSKKAVGQWQFILPTANRYGLKKNWWLDERMDFEKSTDAAISYFQKLFKEFKSWHLVFASYNMGENGLRKRLKKYKTNNFWKLVTLKAIPKETREYVPKIIAALLIAKAPSLYGFNNLDIRKPYEYEYVWAPGGTSITRLADFLDVTRNYLKELNPELTRGYIPNKIKSHRIRIPKGSKFLVSQFLQKELNIIAID